MTVNRRRYARLAALATAAILTFGSAAPVSAGSSDPGFPPGTGVCRVHMYWRGSYSDWVDFTLTRCDVYGMWWKSFVLCGVYWNPPTWHWVQSTWRYTTSDGLYQQQPSCSYNEIVLNIVFDKYDNGLNICWNENAHNWIYNRSDVPCY